jgi:hypothetical protein
VIKLPEVFNPYRHVLVAPFEDLIPDDANHAPNDLVRFLDEFYAFHELRTGHGLEDQERRREQIYAHAERSRTPSDKHARKTQSKRHSLSLESNSRSAARMRQTSRQSRPILRFRPTVLPLPSSDLPSPSAR